MTPDTITAATVVEMLTQLRAEEVAAAGKREPKGSGLERWTWERNGEARLHALDAALAHFRALPKSQLVAVPLGGGQ